MGIFKCERVHTSLKFGMDELTKHHHWLMKYQVVLTSTFKTFGASFSSLLGCKAPPLNDFMTLISSAICSSTAALLHLVAGVYILSICVSENLRSVNISLTSAAATVIQSRTITHEGVDIQSHEPRVV